MEDNGVERRRIDELEEKIRSLKDRMPVHSVPVSMMQELEELEEELKDAKRELSGGNQDAHF